jgi:hypothetical protein
VIDLTALPKRYLDQLGRDRVAEIVGVSSSVLSMWISRKKFPADALQKLLESDPTPLHEVTPFYTHPVSVPKLSIIVPSNRKPETETIVSLTKMMNQDMTFETSTFNSIYHVRNMAAAKFLRSGRPWGFWSDDDTVHQCGDAAWFKEQTGKKNYPDVYAGIHTIFRLMYHQKKFMSGVYVGRKPGAPPQFAGGDTPVMRQLVARGPSQEIKAVDWTGMGCALIHRDVFLDIIKTQPEIAVKNAYIRKHLKYEYGFFNPVDQDYGDDVSFCARARKAGHDVFVDFSVMPVHIGCHYFGYDDIR